MSFNDTQLTLASGYNVNKMVFGKPQNGSVPNTPIQYKRINIGTKNPDGTTGELILETERCFSFGVSENINPETQKVNGYVLPLCLWSKDAPTDPEREWVDTFDAIVEKCKDHLLTIKDDIEKYNLKRDLLENLNPLYWKKVKGKIVDGQGPTLYAKLIQSKKLEKILSHFEDDNGNVIDPLNLIGKYCYVKAAVKIESIFVGKNISLQVKLYEAEVRLIDSGMKRLLKRPVSQQVVTVSSSNIPMLDKDDYDGEEDEVKSSKREDEDDEGSIKGSDVEDLEDEEKPKKVVKKVVKKVIKKIPS
jgi:hypothetical protein